MKGSIKGLEKTLKDILSNKKYTMDYFQREYKWEKEHVGQMIEDLIQEFDSNYSEQDIIQNSDLEKVVAKYNSYFMGSIVLYYEDGRTTMSIIDGQQRLTSLTLLLIYLKRKLPQDDSVNLEDLLSLICSRNFNNIRSYNIEVEGRNNCLEALFSNGIYVPKVDDDISIRNMADRYNEIDEYFEPTLGLDWFKTFTCWLINRVVLVEITATSEDKAYTIFESMNNRGLSLTNTEMLKGFILSKFNDKDKREKFEKQWKIDMENLDKYKKKRNEKIDDVFFQAWLRAHFAKDFRINKKDAINKDMEKIGSRFHNWFKDNFNTSNSLLEKTIYNEENNNIEGFMENNYTFYLKWFLEIKKAETNFSKKLEHIYYINVKGIAESLTYMLLLAPLKVGDSEEKVIEKLELVAKFIDGFVVRRSVNFKRFAFDYIKYNMYNYALSIRDMKVEDLRKFLIDKLKEEDNKFNFQDGMPKFKLHDQNRSFIKYFLCRLTTYIEEGSMLGNDFVKYMFNPNCRPFQIEHIWSDKYDWYGDEFEIGDKTGFVECRNSIGDLVLLQKGPNQSFGEMPVKDINADEKYKDKNKLVYYCVQPSLLTKSLSEKTYENNPNFTKFYKKENLYFKSYSEFTRESINERCKLYADLADKIWNVTLD